MMLSQPNFEDELMQLLPALTQFARSLCRQSADAEDLVQETLVKALKNREKYQPYGSLKSNARVAKHPWAMNGAR